MTFWYGLILLFIIAFVFVCGVWIGLDMEAENLNRWKK